MVDDYFWAAVSLAVLGMLVGLLIMMIADDLRNAKRGSAEIRGSGLADG